MVKRIYRDVNNKFHRLRGVTFSLSLLSYIKDSGFFLTAKDKLVDTYELHAFGVGLLTGFISRFVPEELVLGYWVICLSMLAVALGLDGMRKRTHESRIRKKIKDKALPLRGQIKKEGQYFILGFVIGLILASI